MLRLSLFPLLILLLAACQQEAPQEAAGLPEEPLPVEEVAVEDTELSIRELPIGRLPKTVLPEAYHLELTIKPEEQYFSGVTYIDVELTEPIEGFWMHGRELKVQSAKLILEDGRHIPVGYLQKDESGVVWIDFGSVMDIQHARLRVQYQGMFNEALEGLYRVQDGEHTYAFTQFQAISARLAFPGFDDPDFKTPFTVSLIVDQDNVAISNAPAVEEKLLDNGLKRVDFATTPPLPTYLVAFAVGPFEVVDGPTLPATAVRDRPVPLRGVAVQGKGQLLHYALNHTQDILETMESYFDIPYPYRKLDVIAVPDFNAGAMENAGAITYRETILLLDEGATVQRKRFFRRVHAHELAHQWFGDLVTPVWWNDIWLNEAFATWMADTSLDLIDPDAGYHRDMVGRILGVMELDGFTTARQIRQPVDSNHDIANAFDGITYQKGGGVLVMFEYFLGRERFREGVRNYLKQYAFGNATADEFIAAIAAQSGDWETSQVINGFRSFLEQPGLPQVAVSLSCSGEQSEVSLEQSRYFPLGSSGDQGNEWVIPFCMNYAVEGRSHQQCMLLEEQQQTVALNAQGCPDYLIPTVAGNSYYRWSLDADSLKKLLDHEQDIKEEEWLSTANNLHAGLKSGAVSFDSWVAVLPRLIDSDIWQVSSAPMTELEFILTKIALDEQKEKLQEKMGQLYTDELDEVGLDKVTDTDLAQSQARLVDFMAEWVNDQALREELTVIAGLYLDAVSAGESAQQNMNIITTAMSTAVQDQGDRFIPRLMDMLDQSTDAAFRSRALSALASSRDPSVADQMRQMVLTDRVRDNEVLGVLYTQLVIPELRESLWQWSLENHDALVERLPEWRQNNLILLGSEFCSADKADEVSKFYTPKLNAIQGAPRRLASTLEEIQLCKARADHLQPQLKEWLSAD